MAAKFNERFEDPRARDAESGSRAAGSASYSAECGAGQSTRRDFLAAMLGGSVVAAGCQPTVPSELPPGEIVGPSVDFGHRVRDGVGIQIADREREEVAVVIVGGGIAGLTAARRLLKAGIDNFVLLELEQQAGGTSRSGRNDIVAFPWGAHYVPAPTKDNPDLVALLDELDCFEGTDEFGDPVVTEHLRCRFPEERIWYKGTWYEGLYLYAGATEEDLRQFHDFQNEVKHWAAWRDGQGRRAFAIPMAAGSNDSEVISLDRMTMADWMNRRNFDSPRLRWLVDYACRDDYGMRSEQTSAWAGLFYFASRVPASDRPSRPFITWPEGNGRIVQHLYHQAKAQCRLGFAVCDLSPRADGEIDVTAIDHGGTPHAIRTQQVVFAAPQFLAPYLIADWRKAPPEFVSRFEYGCWAVANLVVSERLDGPGFPAAWDNVLYESSSLGYVSATHQRGIDYGKHVLTWYYPLCDESPRAARTRLLSVDRDGWADVVLADLERAHRDVRQRTERIDIMRWGHAMIRPVPGFVWGGAREQASASYRGIHFGNTDLSGIALFEEAFYWGNEAAEKAIAGLRLEITG